MHTKVICCNKVLVFCAIPMFNSTNSCTFDLNSNDLNLRKKKKLIIKIKNLIYEILYSLFTATKQRINPLSQKNKRA